jgi:hypothetical protein
MDPLKQKIRDTKLFTPQEKVEILASYDAIAEEDRVQLASIIDEYDAKHRIATGTFAQNMNEELDAIVSDAAPQEKLLVADAAGKIRSGLGTMLGE